MKRVYALYRVSTKKQVDVTKDDIPMQRLACREFVKEQGWHLTKEFEEKVGRQICLAVVLVGENPASQVYVRNKIKACEYVGFKSLSFKRTLTMYFIAPSTKLKLGSFLK